MILIAAGLKPFDLTSFPLLPSCPREQLLPRACRILDLQPSLPPSIFSPAEWGFTSLQSLKSLPAAYKMNADLSLKCSISSP